MSNNESVKISGNRPFKGSTDGVHENSISAPTNTKITTGKARPTTNE